MKRLFFTLIILFAGSLAYSQSYKVTFKTPNYKDGLAYLTYYFGKNINIADSAIINSEGVAVFKQNKKLYPGIYSVVFPGKTKLVDFLVDKEQEITVKADTSDLLNKTEITGSKENILFLQYEKFVAIKGKQLQDDKNAYAMSRTKADSVLHEKNYTLHAKELQDYRDNIIKEHPESMLAALFQAMKGPVFPIEHPKTRHDSMTNYAYYKKHYWDGITFMDDRILRTPFFVPKVEGFFRDILVQAPDSIIKEADYLLLFARNNDEMYKYLLSWLADEYINPKYMGQDAVFVHLYEKYFSKGLSPWFTEKQMKQITDRAYMLMSNLVGNKAADLQMVDTSGNTVSLYSINSDYIFVVFWDPTCSHCQQEIPRVDSIYRAKWKAEGVTIFAVLTEKEIEKWKAFIKKHDLKGWMHVYQTDEAKKQQEDAQAPGFKQLYDVTLTPTLYLLDKDKRIIAKKLSLYQMDDVLTMKVKSEKAKAKK
jgi:peroxiredoxin